MKNHILYSAFAALTVAASFSSCEFEQEDFFEESAALRIETTNADIKSKLCAASADGQHGWLIQYFVAGTDEMTFEGFNLFGRFYESGKVILSSDHRFLRNGNAGKYTEYTSFYEMLKEEGSVLAFNTWNDILTVFVDPVNPAAAPTAIVDNGEGMRGDDRLVMESYSDDLMVFHGERYGAKVRFIRADKPCEELLAEINATKNFIASDKKLAYKVTDGEQHRFFTALNDGYFDYCDRLNDPLDSRTLSCVFTTKGFLLQSADKLGDNQFSEFVLSDDKTRLVSVDGGVEALPYWQGYVMGRLVSNRVSITSEGGSEAFVSAYNQLSESITSNFASHRFEGLSFGKSSETGKSSRTGLTFSCKTSTKNYTVGFTATTSWNEATQTVTVAVEVSDHSTNYDSYAKKDIGPFFDAIAEQMSGTYTVTIDNAFVPTTSVWTKTENPAWSFTVKL